MMVRRIRHLKLWLHFPRFAAFASPVILRCHGLVADHDGEFCWLFLEDAGGDLYLLDLEEHRILAGHWLATMNLSAEQIQDAIPLPDRGAEFYLQRLVWSRETIREITDNVILSESGFVLLRSLISHCDALESRWEGIEQFCRRMPLTLVHGDFAVQNARVRSGSVGKALLVIDWGGAGWGVPAPDLAQFVDKLLSPESSMY
jgi:Ser/Thr protein kinase RdoA (MazF antagonist)